MALEIWMIDTEKSRILSGIASFQNELNEEEKEEEKVDWPLKLCYDHLVRYIIPGIPHSK